MLLGFENSRKLQHYMISIVYLETAYFIKMHILCFGIQISGPEKDMATHQHDIEPDVVTFFP